MGGKGGTYLNVFGGQYFVTLIQQCHFLSLVYHLRVLVGKSNVQYVYWRTVRVSVARQEKKTCMSTGSLYAITKGTPVHHFPFRHR